MRRGKMLLLLLLSGVLAVTGCGNGNDANQEQAQNSAAADNPYAGNPDNPVVAVKMANGGTIEIELYPELAPNTVKNFVSLARSGYYDGLIFHRVIPGFMIQGGDPLGNGTGGPGYSIKGEFANNGFDNDLSHTRGVISMARRSDNMDSAGSQFFIMVADTPQLDGDYAAFGKVVSGMETVDAIAAVPTGPGDRPEADQTIQKVSVDIKGKEIGEPETITE